MSSYTSLIPKDEDYLNELRILRKQKQINTAYTSNLLEELKEFQKQYKDLENKLKNSEEFFLKNHNCKENIHFTTPELHDYILLNTKEKKELIPLLLESILSDSLLASK